MGENKKLKCHEIVRAKYRIKVNHIEIIDTK